MANRAMKPAAMGHTFITLNAWGVVYKQKAKTEQPALHLGKLSYDTSTISLVALVL